MTGHSRRVTWRTHIRKLFCKLLTFERLQCTQVHKPKDLSEATGTPSTCYRMLGKSLIIIEFEAIRTCIYLLSAKRIATNVEYSPRVRVFSLTETLQI